MNSPQWAKWLILRLSHVLDRESIQDDLDTEFQFKLAERGYVYATLWFVLHTFRALPELIIIQLSWRMTMIRNYLKIALRSYKKNKIYSAINLIGLSIGLACCLLILRYIFVEISYDRFHENASRIARVCMNFNMGGREIKAPHSSPPMGPTLLKDFPEVVDFVRLYPFPSVSVQYEDKQFTDDRILISDPSIFNIFSFPVIKGDPETILSAPFKLVVTRETASKYFGDDDPVGKVIMVGGDLPMTVTGVVDNVPSNSHFNFDMLCSIETARVLFGDRLESWLSFGMYTYILLQAGASNSVLEEKLPAFTDQHLGDVLKTVNAKGAFFLQPLTQIHLRSQMNGELSANGDIQSIYIYSAIAFFVLIIAAINYMNLSTARAVNRAREVGLRKVLGAQRRRLIYQFLCESLLFCIVAFLLCLVLAAWMEPFFRSINGWGTERPELITWMIPIFMGLILIVGIGAGVYPAFFLSRYRPIHVLKDSPAKGVEGYRFRTVLVIIQFVVSIVLMIGTGSIVRQLQYMRNADLGFQKDQIFVINTTPDSQRRIDVLRQEWLQSTEVVNVTTVSKVPGWQHYYQPILPEGSNSGQSVSMKDLNVDYDFVSTLGLEIVRGRNFSKEMATDLNDAVLINEAAVLTLGWENPIGKKLIIPRENSMQEKTIIGVISDYHMESLHSPIDPLYILCKPNATGSILIRMKQGDTDNSLDFIRDTWKMIVPDESFNGYSLNASLVRLYRSEERLENIFTLFAALAVLIACMGLFGMASFTVQQRVKEIGVRKVLGASVADVVKMLVHAFLKWVLIANLIAWPLAYYVINKWLESYPYREDINFWIFLGSGILAVFIASITVGQQALRTALANPVDALRYE